MRSQKSEYEAFVMHTSKIMKTMRYANVFDDHFRTEILEMSEQLKDQAPLESQVLY